MCESVPTTLFISKRSVRRYCELYILTGAVEPTSTGMDGPKRLFDDNEMMIFIHKYAS